MAWIPRPRQPSILLSDVARHLSRALTSRTRAEFGTDANPHA